MDNQNRQISLKYSNRWIYSREIQIALILIIGVIVLSFTSPFLSFGNLSSIFVGSANEAIIAIGMTILLISGGFDLSVGSVFAFGGIVAGMFAQSGTNMVLSLILGVVSGVVIGLINGLIITKIGVNPLITTLGMLGIVRGLVLVITNGEAPSRLPQSFKILGQMTVYRLQLPLFIMIGMIIISAIFLAYSRFFRQFYFMGGNEKAAILTGIKTNQLKLIAYIISGGLAAFSGVLFTSRVGAPQLTMGQGIELSVISACIIGGCSLEGGRGSILGSFLGVILMSIVINAFNLFGFPVYWQRVVSGVILIAAVSIDAIISKRGEG
jgi:ribose transport system permease protein